MSRNSNHYRAQEVVNSWPSWKREVSLTKHSISSYKSCVEDNTGNIPSICRYCVEMSTLREEIELVLEIYKDNIEHGFDFNVNVFGIIEDIENILKENKDEIIKERD